MEGYSVSERKEVLPKVGKGNVCVIYDSDERYAKRLMGIINDSKDIPIRQGYSQEKRNSISI